MYRGTGVPILVNSGEDQSISLPRPVKGKRKEEFKIETKSYTTIFGKRLVGQTRYRFVGTYEFGEIDSQVISNIVDFLNNGTTVKWIPHSDFPMVNYTCRIIEASPDYFDGNVYKDTIKIKLESVDYVYEIPTLDNMLAGIRKNCRMAVINPT